MTDAVSEANRRLDAWSLGSTSSRFETGGRGPGTVSTGEGDPGGISYGSYQLSSRQPDGRPGTVFEYLAQSPYASRFEGLAPGTDAFATRWRELAATDPGFGKDQHDFIGRTHYDVQVQRLKDQGMDLSERGPAVRDALWSTSVQYRNRTDDIVTKGIERSFGEGVDLSSLTDAQIVTAIQAQKLDANEGYFRSSPARTRANIEGRIKDELDDLLALAKADEIVRNPGPFSGVASSDAFRIENPLRSPLRDGKLSLGEHGPDIGTLQRQLGGLGYTNSRGQTLVADDDFGRGTEHAVRQFQTDRGLPVTGVADEATRQALDRAVLESMRDLPPAPGREIQPQPTLHDPAQRVEDAIYGPIRDQVYAMDRGMGRTPDEASDRVAAALTAEWRANGLSGRPDGVVLGQKGTKAEAGEYVFAYAGSSERPSDWVGVKTAEAVQTPVEQSFAKAEALQRQQALDAQQVAQAQQLSNEGPVRVMG